jgi:HK97 family phage major capsid protein
MSNFDKSISRSDASALIPEEVSEALLSNVDGSSAALSLFRRLPNMSRKQTRMPVQAALASAYFVDGDTGQKQTSDMAWENKYLNSEEIAVIVPVPEAVLDDADYDIWSQVQPELVAAIGRTIDAAVFFGTNKPSSWPGALVPAAIAAGHTVTRGTNAAAAGGLAEDINSAFALVEEDGFGVTGAVAKLAMRGALRGVRNADGDRLPEVSPDSIYGVGVNYNVPGTVWSGDSELIVGDWSQALIALRQDVTYKVLDQAVIQDNTGAIIYNLAQQDMVALRVVVRVAYQVANTINAENTNAATRFPFAVVTAPAGS